MIIKNMMPCDVRGVLAVENVSFPNPWDEEDFAEMLKKRSNHGIVVEIDNEIAGYAIYHLGSGRLNVVSFAVLPKFRRRKVGTKMFHYFFDKVFKDGRRGVYLTSSDTNLTTHLFLKKMGLKAVSVEHDFYGPGHDGYNFSAVMTKNAKSPAKV